MKPLSIHISFIFLSLFSSQVKAQGPNIILIMSDDQGWFDAGFNGNKEIKTPNLDKLASSGITFNRFYSASAVCSPTRASVLTGRNPLRMNIPHANTGHMLKDEITIPELLKEKGYNTAHFGKWHLGTLTKETIDANRGGKKEFIQHYSIPSEHGYDEFFCTESKVPTFDPMVRPAVFESGESLRYGWRSLEIKEESKAYGTAYWDGEEKKVAASLSGGNSKIIMDRVLPFIQKSVQENKLFFSTVWLHTPHLPVVSDSSHRILFKEMSLEKQIYYGTIAAMDEQIGRLWQTLKDLNIQEETLLFFCSDNGPENQTPGSAGPFRERKRSLYEGGLRVPAFAVWKNHIPEGIKTNTPAVTSDYLPTIVEILELNNLPMRPLDGESLWGLMKGKTDMLREKPIGFLFQKKESWVNNRYKLIRSSNLASFELYDLINDPSENQNIMNQHSEIFNEMSHDLEKWKSSVSNSSKGFDY